MKCNWLQLQAYYRLQDTTKHTTNIRNKPTDYEPNMGLLKVKPYTQHVEVLPLEVVWPVAVQYMALVIQNMISLLIKFKYFFMKDNMLIMFENKDMKILENWIISIIIEK